MPIRQTAEVSLNYKQIWDIVIERLIDIYGDYANPEKNLKSYMNSEVYKKQCHKAKKIKSIPIIQPDDITKMDMEDEVYSNQVSELLKLRENYLNSNNNKNIVLKMASILGIMPDDNVGLFKVLVNKEVMSDNEKKHFNEKILKSMNMLEIIVKILSDLFVDGFLVEFDSVGSIMTQPHKNNFYRGENAYYNSSKPSLYRNVNKDNILECEVLGRLRLYECWKTFDKFKAVTNWKHNSINYMALSQHYGLKTQMMDITTNLKTALFFACCKFGEDRKWHPLDKTDFQHRNSRYAISKSNGNSKFGVLYRCPTELTDLKWAIEKDNISSEWEAIIPVGYQPFMRCSSQNAFMLMAKSMSYDIYNDEIFEKYRFPLTEEICNWIYEEMDCGRTIYPNDDIPDISNEIEKINDITTFSQEVYDLYREDLEKFGIDEKEIKRAFNRFGISVDDDIKIIEDVKISYINNNYTLDVAEKLIGVEPSMRPILKLPSDTMVEYVPE